MKPGLAAHGNNVNRPGVRTRGILDQWFGSASAGCGCLCELDSIVRSEKKAGMTPYFYMDFRKMKLLAFSTYWSHVPENFLSLVLKAVYTGKFDSILHWQPRHVTIGC